MGLFSSSTEKTKEAIDRAEGDAERFVAAWEEYRKAENVTALRLYLEAMEEILPKVRKLVADPDAERYIPFPRTLMSEELSPPVRWPESAPPLKLQRPD